MATHSSRGLVSCGVLLALTACTSAGHDTTPTPSSRVSHAAAAPKPTTSSPAHTGSTVPLHGTARLGPQDAGLLNWLAEADLPDGAPPPVQDSVVVIHRGPKDRTGEVGWIGDGHFCLGIRSVPHSTFACGPLETPTHPTRDSTAGSLPWTPLGTDDTVNITLAVVLDDGGPFRFADDDHLGVLYQAQAHLDHNRQVTFLAWSYAHGKFPADPKLCSASTPNCVPAKP